MRAISLTILGFCFAWATAGSSYAVDVARVNSKVITDRDVQISVAGFNEAQKKKILSEPNYRTEIVNNLVEQELLLQDAEKQGLDQDQSYKDALALFRRQYLTERALQKRVTSRVTESASRSFYDGNARKYTTDRVHVLHISVPDLKEANDIAAQAKAGQDFQALAERRSKDPNAKNNRGDLGFLTWESPMAEEFKDAAFTAKKNEIVGPMKTLFGYELIKVTEKIPGRKLEYPEVELRVKADLRKELARGYLTDLRKSSKVTIDEKAVDRVTQ